MKEEKLLKLSIGVSVIGLIGLFVLSQNISPTTLAIWQVDSQGVGKIIQVNGTITSMSTSKDGHTFMDIYDSTGSIGIVAFKSAKIDFTGISRGMNVLVKGKISEYQGRLEIIASEITPISAS